MRKVDVSAHWLIDDERSGAVLSEVGLIEVGAGGAVSFTPQANKEEMVFI